MMLIGGAISALLGLILLIVGIVQNNSLEGMLYAALGATPPGTGWVVVGIILMIHSHCAPNCKNGTKSSTH